MTASPSMIGGSKSDVCLSGTDPRSAFSSGALENQIRGRIIEPLSFGVADFATQK
jgi:hypothetical protein